MTVNASVLHVWINAFADWLLNRLQRDLAGLRRSWQSIQRQLKRQVIFGTVDVIRSWNVAQVRNVAHHIHCVPPKKRGQLGAL